MKRLIKNQNIKFDTHQAGDSQEINLEALHLEKILHDSKNTKIKFHFFGVTPLEKQNTNVDKNIITKIQKEVSSALNKDAKKTEQLGKLLIDTLARYKNNNMDEAEALAVAKKFASYFNLNENFIRKTIKYAKDSKIILEVVTTHSDYTTKKRYKIKQTPTSITLSSRKNQELKK